MTERVGLLKATRSTLYELLPDRESAAKEYWMIYRGPGFLAVKWFASSPAPPPPNSLPSVSSTGDTQEDWERETTCWRERGGGGGWGATAKRLVKYKSFNILWAAIRNITWQDWFCGHYRLHGSRGSQLHLRRAFHRLLQLRGRRIHASLRSTTTIISSFIYRSVPLCTVQFPVDF